MKKELLIASLFAATAAVADSTMTTSNTLGFVPVSSDMAMAKASSDMYLVAVPFAAYGSTDAKPVPVPVSEVIQTANLTKGDELYIPAKDGKYDNYKLEEDKTWTPANVVTLGADGGATVVSGTPATEATVARGSAFWVKTGASQINLLGEGKTDAPTVTAVGGVSKLKWTLVGSTAATKTISLASLGGSKGDVIVLANGTKYLCSGSTWYLNGQTEVTDVTIPAGVGFWYATKTNKSL